MAQREFPRVDMRVDEARHEDVVAAVHDLSPRCFDVAPDLEDLVAFDEHVAAFDVAQLRVHRDDDGVFDKYSAHCCGSFCLISVVMSDAVMR